MPLLVFEVNFEQCSGRDLLITTKTWLSRYGNDINLLTVFLPFACIVKILIKRNARSRTPDSTCVALD